MKKIVGILLAGAMAFSAFAADLTGGVRLAGELFSYNGTSEEVKGLMLKNENQFYHVPLTLSISSDRAGGTFKMCDKDSDTMISGDWAIWFKPMDMLQVNLGKIAKSMNTESITYTNRVLNYDSFGASLDVNVDAFSATLSVVPGKATYWMSKAKGAEVVLGELNLYAQYAADFGTISAMLDFSENFDKISIAAGYKNTFGDITMFADAAVVLKENANKFYVDADVVYAKDALNAQAYVLFDAPFEGIAKDTIHVKTLAKVSYNLGSVTPYLQFSDDNILASSFACQIKPGVTGSVGIMNYEVAAQFDIAKKVNISVPVNFAVNF